MKLKMLFLLVAATLAATSSTANAQVGPPRPCVPFPICLGGGSPSPQSGHAHASAGKIAGQVMVYGLAASSGALIVRGAYVAATENREMLYGEAYCTAELFSPLVFKPLRLLGGQVTSLEDVIFCPQEKLNKFSAPPKPKAHKKHKKKRNSAVLPRPRP